VVQAEANQTKNFTAPVFDSLGIDLQELPQLIERSAANYDRSEQCTNNA
jgi:hypothetical protein